MLSFNHKYLMIYVIVKNVLIHTLVE